MIDTKKISSLQLGILTFFLAKSSFFPIVSSMIINSSKHNVWISIILGMLIGLIPLLIYIFINKFDHKRNIIELNNKTFGKVLGNIINTILCIGIIISSTILLLGICSFVYSNFLYGTPLFVIALLLLLVVSYASIKGIETICRTSQILFIISIMLFLTGFISLIYYIDINNFKPLFDINIGNLLNSTYNVLLFSISPVLVLSIIPYDIVIKQENYNKSLIIGYISALIVVLLTICSTIGTLGSITSLFQYPEFIALKSIDYFHFFERVESVISIQWIFDAFVYLLLANYFLKKYISSMFNIKKEKTNNIVVLLFSILILILSNILFTNSLNTRNIIINNYSIILLFSFIVIPIIVFIKLKFKKN